MATLTMLQDPSEATGSRPIKRLGQLLVRRGVITEGQLQRAVSLQEKNGRRLGACMTQLGYANEHIIALGISEQHRLPFLDLLEVVPAQDALDALPKEDAERYQAVPVSRHGRILRVAITDPGRLAGLDELQRATGLTICPGVCTESQFSWAMEQFYMQGRKAKPVTKKAAAAAAGSR
ncbi:MAG TPA: hypothetical protein VFY29_09890 [Terriglobia bacterium]|nr:hypothetical protein [Terriglobia bacterium]